MDQAVQVWREKRVGRMRLNRPKALNALDLEMIGLMHTALNEFRDDAGIHAVLVDATGERGFCAGGDIRAIRQAGAAQDAAGIAAFFGGEYALNAAIAAYPKPYVALINGVCMGGGIGISAHGSHRIASEFAMFAMPETAIGLFPDVGTTFVLPRLPGALGMYLGLTGARLTGADAVHAGFATHFVPRAALAALAASIATDGVAVIAEFAASLPPFSLAPHRAVIDRAFSLGTVAEVFAALEQEDGEFAQHTLAALRAASPLALHWSFEIIHKGASRSLAQCLEAELALVKQVAMHPEFHEGVRAAVIDKDRKPNWQPARIEDINPAVIAALFA